MKKDYKVINELQLSWVSRQTDRDSTAGGIVRQAEGGGGGAGGSAGDRRAKRPAGARERRLVGPIGLGSGGRGLEW